jgi:hypothetical protein
VTPRRQSRRTVDAASLEIEIERLRDLDLKALRLRWQGVAGRSAPVHLQRHLLFAMLAYGDCKEAWIRSAEAAALDWY